MPVSPLCIKSGDEDLLTFHYRTIALWELDAHQYVRDHNLAMYVLLPTMKSANAPLVLQAIQEMADNYREETTKLYQQLIWMEILMRRSGAMSAEAKETVYRRLSMFERIWDEDPKVQAITAEAKKKGWQQGIEQGDRTGDRERGDKDVAYHNARGDLRSFSRLAGTGRASIGPDRRSSQASAAF